MAMNMFFEVRIRYEKMMENGQNKKVNEPYLVDALRQKKQKRKQG